MIKNFGLKVLLLNYTQATNQELNKKKNSDFNERKIRAEQVSLLRIKSKTDT